MPDTPTSTSSACTDADSRAVDAAWRQIELLGRTASPAGSSETVGLPSHAIASGTGLPPDSFPGYRILREIHRGGQGVVYLALQESTRRKVAIKVPRGGRFAAATELARFEREVEILSRLQHPHIVTIHDRGQAGGQAYYVMDYVPGRALDAYVADGELTTDEKLRIFVRICDAVNAAHLRGVIHRDLKPSNIRMDEGGEPRILDFGVAKLTAGSMDDSSAPTMTVTGQFVGSLPWASPEQAQGNSDQIDVRTDVYSLGVVLYQMLTNVFPYPVAGRMQDVIHNITSAVPIRPSTICRGINDDIETIVLKCLAKEPERRYQSAGELARDIRHYLAGEAIEAKRDSAWYVMRKALRRHRVAAGISAAFVLLLAGSSLAMFWLYRQGVDARRTAQDRQELAERQAEKAYRVQQFFREMLSSIDPDIAAGRDTALLEQVLADAGRRLESELTGQPEVRAAIHATIGSTYRALCRFAEAEEHLAAALTLRQALWGTRHRDVAVSLNGLAALRNEQGRYEDAETLLRQALALWREISDASPLDLAANLNNLALAVAGRGEWAEAESLHRRALDLRISTLGPAHSEVASSMRNLGLVLKALGRFEEAQGLYASALEIVRKRDGQAHPRTASILNSLGALHREKSEFGPAEKYLAEALEIRRAAYPQLHQATADSLNSVGMLHVQKRDFQRAEPFLREAVAMRQAVLGDEHPHVCTSLNNLAHALHGMGRLDEAEPLYRQALDLHGKLGGDQNQLAGCLNNMAALLQARGDLAGSEQFNRKSLELRRTLYGDEHVNVAESLNNLGTTLVKCGEAAAAEPLFREALQTYHKRLGQQSYPAAVTLTNLAWCLLAQRLDDPAAEPLLREALDILAAVVSADHPASASAKLHLGRLLMAQKRYAEAEAHLLDSLTAFEARGGANRAQSRTVTRLLIRLYDAWGKPDEAATWRAKLGDGSPPGGSPTPTSATPAASRPSRAR